MKPRMKSENIKNKMSQRTCPDNLLGFNIRARDPWGMACSLLRDGCLRGVLREELANRPN